jgi:ribosomal protein L4
VSVLNALGLPGKVLVVLAAPDEAAEKSFANVERVKLDFPGNLSTFDLIYADHVLFTTEALNALTGESWERSEKEAEPEATDQPEEAAAEVPDDEEAEG